MHEFETLPARREAGGPELTCAELPAFDESDLSAVRRAFQTVVPCALGQAWQPETSPGFAPAAVWTGWREDALLVFAELTDRDIFTRATVLNQRMWELGDTFEMFLRPAGQKEYFEFHVTPNNQRLQLRIPSAEALRLARVANVFDKFLLPGDVFRSVTWVQPENKKWFAYVAIPSTPICGQAQIRTGSRWHFSFSRYDYTHGQSEPVISSTSSHAQPDFHRQDEWGVMIFQTGHEQSETRNTSWRKP